MVRQRIDLPGVVQAAPFSPALVWQDLVFVSGQVGRDGKSGVAPADIAGQTRICLENVKALVERAGASLDDALKATIYMTDMAGEFAAMNEVFRTFFPGTPPARSTVGVAHLAKPDLRIEMDFIVARKR